VAIACTSEFVMVVFPEAKDSDRSSFEAKRTDLQQVDTVVVDRLGFGSLKVVVRN